MCGLPQGTLSKARWQEGVFAKLRFDRISYLKRQGGKGCALMPSAQGWQIIAAYSISVAVGPCSMRVTHGIGDAVSAIR